MRHFLTVVFVFVSMILVAQHKVTVTATSDFKTIKDGFVESTFIFDSELSKEEIAQFSQWVSDNSKMTKTNLTGKNLSVSFNYEVNNRNVYAKMFHLLGIDVLEVTVNGQKKVMDQEAFFDHFNL